MSPSIQINPIKEVHTKTTVLGCHLCSALAWAIRITRKACLLLSNSCYSNKNITSDFQVLSCQGVNFILIHSNYISPFGFPQLCTRKSFKNFSNLLMLTRNFKVWVTLLYTHMLIRDFSYISNEEHKPRPL